MAEVVPSRLKLKELTKVSPLGVLGSMGSGALVSILIGLSAIYLENISLPFSEIALFMSIIIFWWSYCSIHRWPGVRYF